MKADGEQENINQILGTGGDVQLVPMFVPANTYRLLLEAGKQRGQSVTDLISRALEMYLQSKPEQDIKPNRTDLPARKPNFVIKRK